MVEWRAEGFFDGLTAPSMMEILPTTTDMASVDSNFQMEEYFRENGSKANIKGNFPLR